MPVLKTVYGSSTCISVLTTSTVTDYRSSAPVQPSHLHRADNDLESRIINQFQDDFYDLHREVSAERAQWSEEMISMSYQD